MNTQLLRDRDFQGLYDAGRDALAAGNWLEARFHLEAIVYGADLKSDIPEGTREFAQEINVFYAANKMKSINTLIMLGERWSFAFAAADLLEVERLCKALNQPLPPEYEAFKNKVESSLMIYQ